MADPQYHLEIESDPKNLITVEEFINYFSKDLNLDDEKISGLMLSITEATTNAIIHANKNDPNKLVQIDVDVEGENLIIKVKDEGKGFNPNEVPDPTEPENLMKDSGRGLYLMRVYMDELKYNLTPSGMETILTIKLH